MTARQTAARLRAVKPRGEFAARRQRNARPTLWTQGEFVAIDGEGFSDGAEFEEYVGVNQTLYRGKHHVYAYLASSDGRELYNDRGRLRLLDCLAFLCGIGADNPHAILVVFGGSYDVAQFVSRDLGLDDCKRLIGKGDGKPCIVTGGGYTYRLNYRPRKCLEIYRWREGERRWETNPLTGKRQATPHLTVRLWDVFGFFQESFTEVMRKWVPGDPDYEFIRRMKGDRSTFDRSEIDDIRRYNAAELRILVKIMNRVRDAINDLGLKITRWDGAGAVAAAMMSKHGVKKHKAPAFAKAAARQASEVSDAELFEATRRAYSGGHIESCKLGTYRGRIYHYDINSAYPDQFRRLPSLALGQWIVGAGDPPQGYTLVKVEFAFPDGLPFYPLFYRCEDGSIFYPRHGRGWYWWSEYDVARRYHAECLVTYSGPPLQWRATAWFHFREDGDERPFGWVEDYYSRRQDYIRAARRGGFESGPEKIIKLGLNALYGKTAQQVGARVVTSSDGTGHGNVESYRLPPFFQLDWAGFVTAGCRARMMEAALQKPHAVIMFATDGLFTTEPLDLHCPAEKELGAWEAKEHDGITVVMPGVYWLADEDKTTHYSRGFNKSDMASPEFVHQAWRERKDQVAISLTRLVGIGSACSSKQLWKLRGAFCESRRYLTLDGDNSKRYPLAPHHRPYLQLCPLEPRDHLLENILGVPESAPYPIAWLDGTTPPRDDPDMLEWLDEIDAELI